MAGFSIKGSILEQRKNLYGSSTFTGSETLADLNPSGNTSVTMTAQWQALCASGVSSETVTLNVNGAKDYNYTGAEKCVILKNSGYYKLEVWGAEGRTFSTSYPAGRGGYAVGIINSSNVASRLYINVGGQGANTTFGSNKGNLAGGYNGGGSTIGNSDPNSYWTTGGGATHIATVSGTLPTLEAYKGTLSSDGSYYNSSEILIVAGGGGGTSRNVAYADSKFSYGGSGGGYKGGDSGTVTYSTAYKAYGGLQTGIYPTDYSAQPSFGQGASGVISGGGGGFYGGGVCGYIAGGGSGYIGSSNLISGGGVTKHMTCYSCTTSTAAATRTNSNTNVSATATADYSKTGNGYARITYLGTSI
ncbi:hypothetical protein J6W91_03555 [Candidatus Saccharibacteria bacterium]|nr:hypothetical protein [Candidatus Saccharibacteria bacterium]